MSDVVQSFKHKNYKLADEFLESDDFISDIEFILGSVSFYCIPSNDVVFGESNCSVISKTPIGILLRGEISRLKKDINYLPELPDSSIDTCTFNIGVKLDKPCDSNNDQVYVIDNINKGLENKIKEATNDMLEIESRLYLNSETQILDEASSETNSKLIKFALDKTTLEEDGRLRMPLLWNTSVSHLLGKNYNLSIAILNSNFKKLSKDKNLLKMVDKTFKEQESNGIIERIPDLDGFLLQHPECSFLPHMSTVIKPDRDTTKCRVVFLSNLCEKDPMKPITMSHNQTIHSGPCLNQKLITTLTHMRFDRFILCFDIKKAFNMISLSENDANKLLFLWYRNVDKGDYSIVAYKNSRLPFGLRCSPTLLMLALFKILVVNSSDDNYETKKMKELIYMLSYMDNLAVSDESSVKLQEFYEKLSGIFEPYKFSLQQFLTNFDSLQKDIDDKFDKQTDNKVKLLGLEWDRSNDTLSTKQLKLNAQANTKRSILSSIASNFDIFNFNSPILNRSKLFMHKLQCNSELGWDQKLSSDQIKEWSNISKQVNDTPIVEIKRYIGPRDAKYRIIGFSDSSKVLYGVVVYLQNIDTKEVSFLMAKSKIINRQLEGKSIPSL